MQIGTSAVSATAADPSMTFLGLLTGRLSVKGLGVTTTDLAPKNSILIHPATLTNIANASDGLLDLVKPGTNPERGNQQGAVQAAVQVPITVQNTADISLKLLHGSIDDLTPDEAFYVSRVLNLPESDISHRLLQVTADVRDVVRASQDQQPISEVAGQAVAVEEVPQVEENQVNPVCDRCLDKLDDVFSTVQQFVDEYGINGPGYVDVTYDADVTEEVLVESVNRYKENEENSPSPNFSESLSRSLAVEVARNMIYEKLIVDLAEKVGFAEDTDDEDEGKLFGV